MMKGSGSVPLTNGSGSGGPKNLRIRIRNTRLNKLLHQRVCTPYYIPPYRTEVSSLGRYVFGSEISYNKAPPRLPGLGC
jgi:hypothetical protein